MRFYLTEVHQLGGELSISATLAPVTAAMNELSESSPDHNPHRDDEPYRRALVGIYARLAATLQDLTGTEALRHAVPPQNAYLSASDFLADLRVIDDAYRRAARLLSPAIATSYAEYLADKSPDADDIEEALIEAHVDIAALGLLPEVQGVLDAEADKLARTWLTDTRVARKSLNDDRQDVYRQIIATSTDPQDVEIAKPEA